MGGDANERLYKFLVLLRHKLRFFTGAVFGEEHRETMLHDN